MRRQHRWHGTAVAVFVVAVVLLLRASTMAPTAAHDTQAFNNSGGARDAAQHRVPCFSFNETDAALLEPRLVTALQERQARVEGLEDWTQLGVRSRAELAQVAFTIPKVIHQVWLGPRPPPTDLLDTWR
jgi:hypothetical protein